MHLTIALLLLSPSAEPAPTTGTEITVVAPEKPKKICRAGAATGTRVTHNICKTQAEWDAQISPHFNKMDAVGNNGRSGN